MTPWYLSKTTWALVAALIGAIAELVGVKIDPLQMSSLVSDLTEAGQAISIIAPVVAAILHHISSKKAQSAIIEAQQGKNTDASKP